MKNSLLVLALPAFAGCCFLYGSYSDMALIRAIFTRHASSLNPTLRFISDTTAYVSFCLVLPFLLWYAVSRGTPRHAMAPNQPRKRSCPILGGTSLLEGSILLGALLLTTLLVQTLKYLIHRPRPYEVYSFVQKLSDAGGGSFPSGHTADAFTVLAFFCLGRYPYALALPVFAWALAVAYSRIALGVHYGSDVLGAVVLGTLSAWTARSIANSYYPVRQPHPPISKI